MNKHSLADPSSSAILTQLVRSGQSGMGGGDAEGHLARSPEWLGLTALLDNPGLHRDLLVFLAWVT